MNVQDPYEIFLYLMAASGGLSVAIAGGLLCWMLWDFVLEKLRQKSRQRKFELATKFLEK